MAKVFSGGADAEKKTPMTQVGRGYETKFIEQFKTILERVTSEFIKQIF
jgi:hypothetical protein